MSMVLAGRVIFRDRLSLLQKLAVTCAMLGVGNALYQVGGVSWSILVVALGYPVYFILRRHFGTDNLGGLWCELALMLPVAAWFAFRGAARQPGALFADTAVGVDERHGWSATF